MFVKVIWEAKSLSGRQKKMEISKFLGLNRSIEILFIRNKATWMMKCAI